MDDFDWGVEPTTLQELMQRDYDAWLTVWRDLGSDPLVWEGDQA